MWVLSMEPYSAEMMAMVDWGARWGICLRARKQWRELYSSPATWGCKDTHILWDDCYVVHAHARHSVTSTSSSSLHNVKESALPTITGVLQVRSTLSHTFSWGKSITLT